MPACECSSSSSGRGHPFSTASRRRWSDPTPGFPPHENVSLCAQPAPISWSYTMSGVILISARSRRPCRISSCPAACGIRWVKPSSATESPSRTSSATASESETTSATSGGVFGLGLAAGPAQQLVHGEAALVSVVACQLVDVHRHEPVGGVAVDPAPEPERVLHRLVAVFEPRADRLAENGGDVHEAAAEVAPRDVDAERQREPRLEQPPLAEVEHLREPG